MTSHCLKIKAYKYISNTSKITLTFDLNCVTSQYDVVMTSFIGVTEVDDWRTTLGWIFVCLQRWGNFRRGGVIVYPFKHNSMKCERRKPMQILRLNIKIHMLNTCIPFLNSVFLFMSDIIIESRN